MGKNSSTVLFAEVLQTTLRSWWTLVAGLCVGISLGIVAWNYLPKTYEAKTTIFVAPSQIPGELDPAPSIDAMAMRLATLKESVLSRPYISRLAVDAFGYSAEEAGSDQVQDAIRQNVGAKIAHFDDRRGSGVVELTFQDSDPVRAANVINALADHYMQENVKAQSNQAAQTTNVLSDLAGDVGKTLQQREHEIASFKQAHLNTLPEHRETNMRLLESRQHDLDVVEADLAHAQENRDLLVAQAEQAKNLPAGADATASQRESRAQRIARVQNELRALRDRYTEQHPLVKLKREELERALHAPKDDDQSTVAGTAISADDEFAPKIKAAENEIARLKASRDQAQNDIRALQGRLAETPRTDQQLQQLSKGYDVLLDKYKAYTNQAVSARGTEKITQLRKGDQFEVMERAVAPEKPVRPIPLLVIAAGVLLGLAAFVGPVVLRASVSPKILSREGLKLMSPVPVLISIHEIHTPKTRRARVRRALWNWGAVAVSICLLAATVAGFVLVG